jgi:hypothetical protein
VSRMSRFSILDALGAEVPVRAVQAFVTHAIDKLLATITDGRVAHIPTSIAKEVGNRWENSFRGSCFEGMARVMAMLVAYVALHAEIVVLARGAGNELFLGQNPNAAIASAVRLLGGEVNYNRLLLIHERTRHPVIGLQLGLRGDTLSGAVDDIAVLYKSLDHPVANAGTMNASIDAGRAKIVVPMVANAAVEMLIVHRLVAVVAEDDPAALWILLGTEGQVGVVGSFGGAVEEALTCGEGARDRSLALIVGFVRRDGRHRAVLDRFDLWFPIRRNRGRDGRMCDRGRRL